MRVRIVFLVASRIRPLADVNGFELTRIASRDCHEATRPEQLG